MNTYEIYLDNIRRTYAEPLSEKIVFDRGLTTGEIREIEAFWGFHFPKSLTDFFRCAFPVRDKFPVVPPWQTSWEFEPFPDWRDFSEKNVNHIREWMEAPVKNLVNDMKRDGWMCDNWIGLTPDEVGEAAPKLIPVYGHRFLPVCSFNPPVFSAVGRDVVIYGADLWEYLRHEWLDEKPQNGWCAYVPVWSDIAGWITRENRNPFLSAEEFLAVLRDRPGQVNEAEFRFLSDPVSPKQEGYLRGRAVGYTEGMENPYWIGGCDIPDGIAFETAQELFDAPVFGGHSMRERWDEVIWFSVMGLEPAEWMELYGPGR